MSCCVFYAESGGRRRVRKKGDDMKIKLLEIKAHLEGAEQYVHLPAIVTIVPPATTPRAGDKPKISGLSEVGESGSSAKKAGRRG